jgi:hypothetical protein
MASPTRPTACPLTPGCFGLLAAHRAAVAPERTFPRATGLAVGWLLTLGRPTRPRPLAALGLGEVDWAAFHRRFSRPRFRDDTLCQDLRGQTLALAPAAQPDLATVDGTIIPRRSRTRPGTGWLRAPGPAPCNRGLARCQRFGDLCWLPLPSPAGDRRAVPLRWAPAFPPKAVPAAAFPPQPEAAAGLAQGTWLRADTTFASTAVGKELPAHPVLLGRCQQHRVLVALPDPPPTGPRGRKRLDGEPAPSPAAWLAKPDGWQQASFLVRGRTVRPTYRVEGPDRLKRAADHPVFLLVVKGGDRHARQVRREPTYWLVSVVPTADRGGTLPAPAATVLAWAWQRWAIAVAHRDQKPTFGLGQPQAWSVPATGTTTQGTGERSGVVLLTGLTVWGQERPRRRPRPRAGGAAAAAGVRPSSGRRCGPSCGTWGTFSRSGAEPRSPGRTWPTGRRPRPTPCSAPATPEPRPPATATPTVAKVPNSRGGVSTPGSGCVLASRRAARR